MKKIFIPVIIMVLIVACNSAENTNQTHHEPKTLADTLMDDVMKGHDGAMAKMGKLSAAQKRVQQALDSVIKLPAKSQQTSVAYKTQLDSLSAKLKFAEGAMDKWMEEFNMDSAANNIELRTKYLDSEKQKVNSVKEIMLSALQQADSLFKK